MSWDHLLSALEKCSFSLDQLFGVLPWLPCGVKGWTVRSRPVPMLISGMLQPIKYFGDFPLT